MVPGKQGLRGLHKFPQWLGRRLDQSTSTVPINSKTPQLLPPCQGVAKVALLGAFHGWPLPFCPGCNEQSEEKQLPVRSRKSRLAGGARLRSRGVGGGGREAHERRAGGRGQRRRQGKGRWRSRGGRSSLFVFVARWLPASHHVTRTRGRRAAPSAAAAAATSLRGSGRLRPALPRLLPVCPAGTAWTPAAPQPPPRHVTREPSSSRDAGLAAVRGWGVLLGYSPAAPRPVTRDCRGGRC